jgi:hypothetical protein
MASVKKYIELSFESELISKTILMQVFFKKYFPKINAIIPYRKVTIILIDYEIEIPAFLKHLS